jgi:hypothetical protein
MHKPLVPGGGFAKSSTERVKDINLSYHFRKYVRVLFLDCSRTLLSDQEGTRSASMKLVLVLFTRVGLANTRV